MSCSCGVVDAEHLPLLRAVGMRSALIVPMTAAAARSEP